MVREGRKLSAFDNAMCESFFATLEFELIKRQTYATRSEARLSIFDYIEVWYNPHRIHSPEVARAYDVHPVTLSNWKKQLKENGRKASGGDDDLEEKQDKIAKLERMVG